ncbi:MAG: transketolase [Polyangiaceae bacterium]|jgi:transketolase
MPREYDSQQTHRCVSTIRGLAIDEVEKAKSGHPGTPMGLADLAFEIFVRYLRHDPKHPQWMARDRFVLSAGHASALLYAMLHLSGYDLPLSELEAFRQWGSKTPGHPERGVTPGVEMTTGPLGQGVGSAIGMALALKLKLARFGEPFAASRVFCVAGDGDMMEGVSAEASSIAGHLGLDNLVLIYDDNHITIEGDTALAYSDDACKRYESYGWFAQFVDDGHDHGKIREALDRALAQKGRPSFIRLRTHIGYGAPHKQDTKEAHGEPLGADEVKATKLAMGFDPDKTFVVPSDVRALFQERAAELAKDYQAWTDWYDQWRGADAERAARLDAFEHAAVASSLYDELFQAVSQKPDATRSMSASIEQVVAKHVPSLIGGAADLAPSTKTLLKDGAHVGPGNFNGRNVHFGIREHAMGAICNGLALSGGIIPFGSTFLIFSDYMRPSIRMSALMGLQCIWIFTHDSIFVGEDGPTHEPIEQISSLRLVPRLFVVRPADAVECAAAWVMALQRRDGPTALILTRQQVPQVQRDPSFEPRDTLKGAYIVQEAAGGTPDAILVATGSELHLAVGAKARLEAEGRKVRVVSAPCLEAFEGQDLDYRERVLPRSVRKASIEAGRTYPWLGIVGADGLMIGVDRYGASAPDKVIAQKFGFTVDAVAEKVRAWIA